MSNYGNVPADDVEVVGASARIAAQVVASMPVGSAHEWREAAFEAVLGAILHDWVDNGTTDLDDGDVEDLGNLLKLAVDVANAQEASLRDAAFRTVLKGVLEDWIANWGTGD